MTGINTIMVMTLLPTRVELFVLEFHCVVWSDGSRLSVIAIACDRGIAIFIPAFFATKILAWLIDLSLQWLAVFIILGERSISLIVSRFNSFGIALLVVVDSILFDLVSIFVGCGVLLMGKLTVCRKFVVRFRPSACAFVLGNNAAIFAECCFQCWNHRQVRSSQW